MRLVPPCCVIFDLKPFSLSFVLRSLNLFLVCLCHLCHLAILCLDQHAHTLHHLESLLTIYFDNLCLDNLDIFKEDLEYQRCGMINSRYGRIWLCHSSEYGCDNLRFREERPVIRFTMLACSQYRNVSKQTTRLIHIESRKSPTAELFDVDSGRISIVTISICAVLFIDIEVEQTATYSISIKSDASLAKIKEIIIEEYFTMEDKKMAKQSMDSSYEKLWYLADEDDEEETYVFDMNEFPAIQIHNNLSSKLAGTHESLYSTHNEKYDATTCDFSLALEFLQASKSHTVGPVYSLDTFEEEYKVESEVFDLLKIDVNLFTCDTPIRMIFKEFSRLSSMKDDLFA
ncbi:hypothetical protein Tco_0544216 [Tanacetum coccineum]